LKVAEDGKLPPLTDYGIQAIAYRDKIVPGVNPDGRRLVLPKFRRA